jgi:hypothetical protein
MKKEVVFLMLFIFLFQVTDVDALLDFGCNVRDSCLSNENIIFYMYSNLDSHVSRASDWSKKLCCSNIRNICPSTNFNVLGSNLFKLYYENDGHVSIDNVNYKKQICLSYNQALRGQGYFQCTYRENSNCLNDEKCIISLYSKDDTHVSDCSSNGYRNKLCCKVEVCPKDFYWFSDENKCVPTYSACYIGDVGSSISKQGNIYCQNKWSAPVLSSTNPNSAQLYWKDALTETSNQDCFDSSVGYNKYACCLSTVYNNEEYGTYTPITVKKSSIENIFTSLQSKITFSKEV